MRHVGSILLILFLLVVAVPVGTGAAAAQCLSQAQTREAITSGAAKRLSWIRGRISGVAEGEVIGANLCVHRGIYVYRITVLSRTGKVTEYMVHAASGAVLR